MEIREPPERMSLPRPASARPKTIRVAFIRLHEIIEQPRESVVSISHTNMPKYIFYFYYLFFLAHCKACGILVPQPGIKTSSPAMEAWSLKHWAGCQRSSPNIHTLNKHYKEHSADIRDVGLISVGKILWRRLGNPLQYSRLGNPRQSGPRGHKGLEMTEAT